MTKSPGKKSAADAARTKRKVVLSAAHLFARKGFAGTSVRDVAARAGVTHGLIRHHFGTKEDLWRGVVDFHIAEIESLHQPFLDRQEETDPLLLLKAFATNFIEACSARPDFTCLLASEGMQAGPRLDYVYERMLPIHRAIEPVFLAARSNGALDHFDPDSFFVFLLSLGAFPVAFADFANRFSAVDIRTEAGQRDHVDRVIATLFSQRC